MDRDSSPISESGIVAGSVASGNQWLLTPLNRAIAARKKENRDRSGLAHEDASMREIKTKNRPFLLPRPERPSRLVWPQSGPQWAPFEPAKARGTSRTNLETSSIALDDRSLILAGA